MEEVKHNPPPVIASTAPLLDRDGRLFSIVINVFYMHYPFTKPYITKRHRIRLISLFLH